MRRRLFESIVTCLTVAALAGCGGSDGPGKRAAQRTPEPAETPAATSTPTATPTAEAGHDGGEPAPEPTPTATPAPATGGAQAGDEEGIVLPVEATLGEGGIHVKPATIAAFLPLRLTVRNPLDRPLDVVVVRAGGDAEPVARLHVAAGATATERIDGLRAGELEVLSPGLGPSATATVTVKAGG